MKTKTLTPELLHKMDAYWRAANYLSVGQIYLYDNPLLKRPLTLADGEAHASKDTGARPPGRTSYTCTWNRVIKKYNLDAIYVSGPGTAARPSWQHVSRRHVQRDLSRHQPG